MAFLLAKPTPLNVNHDNGRFSMFNKKRDIAAPLWVDGLFINAIDLVNGSSITVQSAVEVSEIEYLLVKLARHDVIFAQDAPSETLLVQSGNVERFDNFVE